MQPSLFFQTIGKSIAKSGFATSPSDAWVALEFENETKKPFTNPIIPGYTFHVEHSLRHHGFEYVFEKPVPLADVRKKADDYLAKIQLSAGPSNPLTCSSRTSTHVHWDITKLTFIQGLNWAILYWLVEDLLSEFCGVDRQANHFCLRMKDAMMTQSSLIGSVKSCKPWYGMCFGEEYRYGSLNLNAWKKFGSMEFRMLQGVDSSEKLMDWIYALENIRKFSLKFENPWEIYKFFIDKTPAEEFPEKAFGQYWPLISKHLPKNYDVGANARYAFMLLTPLFLSGGDWKFTKELKTEAEQKSAGIVTVEEIPMTQNPNALLHFSAPGLASLAHSFISPMTGIHPIFPDTPVHPDNQLPETMYEDYTSDENETNTVLLNANYYLFTDV